MQSQQDLVDVVVIFCYHAFCQRHQRKNQKWDSKFTPVYRHVARSGNDFKTAATLDLVTVHPRFVTHSQKGSIYIPHQECLPWVFHCLWENMSEEQQNSRLCY